VGSGTALAGRRTVGIFSLSSHSVITVIMVWTSWTAPRRRAGRRGGPLIGSGGRHESDWCCRGGRSGGHPAGRPAPAPKQAGSSTIGVEIRDAIRPICPQLTAVVHRIWLVVHTRARQNRFRWLPERPRGRGPWRPAERRRTCPGCHLLTGQSAGDADGQGVAAAVRGLTIDDGHVLQWPPFWQGSRRRTPACESFDMNPGPAPAEAAIETGGGSNGRARLSRRR